MPSDYKSGSQQPLTPPLKKAKAMPSHMALAMELPFTIVAAIVVGGFLGYFADHRFRTAPLFMIAGGALGFAASMIDIVRRFRPR